jgi:hypothetical protein
MGTITRRSDVHRHRPIELFPARFLGSPFTSFLSLVARRLFGAAGRGSSFHERIVSGTDDRSAPAHFTVKPHALETLSTPLRGVGAAPLDRPSLARKTSVTWAGSMRNYQSGRFGGKHQRHRRNGGSSELAPCQIRSAPSGTRASASHSRFRWTVPDFRLT